MNRIALGTRKGLMIFELKGSSWKLTHHAFPGTHVSYVAADPRSGHLFACLDDGHFGNKVFRWDDFSASADVAGVDPGEVWNELAAPRYPEGAAIRDDIPAVLKYMWGWAVGSDDQPGRIYLGTEPGGMFVSDDDGDQFTLVESLWNHPSRTDADLPWMGGGRDEAAIHSICIDPRDSNRVGVGVSVAGVFLSDDGLETWQPRNKGLRADFLPDPFSQIGHDPHLLVQCHDQPNIWWQQNHCGIFRSTDDTLTWSDVSEPEGPAKFGFAVAVDPHDGETAWVVPAISDMNRTAIDGSLYVARTTDGGENWEQMRKGLPQENCFDFVFRHSLIQSGDHLMFGTACGSLYWSTDRGASWTAISYHLPPIYIVTAV